MAAVLKRLFGVALAIVFMASIAIGIDAGYFFSTPLPNTRGKLISVDPGMSFTAIARRLRDEDILAQPRYAYYLALYARFTGQAVSVKSGEYVVPAAQTPVHLVDLLVSGRTRQHRLTLVEGRRFTEIRTRLADDGSLDHRLTGKSDAEVMAALGHPDEQPEGRFMPDTYLFPRGMTDTAFLARAYKAMHVFLAKAWSHRADDLAVDTPYQALILASIVEKETAVPAERARIAGVFSRRLKQGMRLQTDPSVIYGIENYDGNIHRSDLERDTPYNTYTRAGLPPTPIATPSRASIRAALHPMPGKSLYFVARGDGSHVFSDTLAEHNKAVHKFQKSGS